MALNVIKELGVLNTHGYLGCEGGEPFLVLGVKGPAPFVQDLTYPNGLSRFAEDRHAENRSGEETSLLVEGWVKPQVCIGMRDVDCFSGSKNGSGYAEVIGNPNG